MKTSKLIILLVFLLAIPYPAWYGVNWYSAGLVDQTALIEFGMEDDFMYCNDWRPELLDLDKQIIGYNVIYKININNDEELKIFFLEIERINKNNQNKNLILITPDDDQSKVNKPSYDIKCWVKIYQFNQISGKIMPCSNKDHYHLHLSQTDIDVLRRHLNDRSFLAYILSCIIGPSPDFSSSLDEDNIYDWDD